jgi:hypothetical protein
MKMREWKMEDGGWMKTANAVMLSEAKHLALEFEARPFAALRVTRFASVFLHLPSSILDPRLHPASKGTVS